MQDIIYCTLLLYIFILSIFFMISLNKAEVTGLALQVTPKYPVWLNNDAGSHPHGPRQMAGSTLQSPPWPRSPPCSQCTCTPTLPPLSYLFVLHLAHTTLCKPFPQLTPSHFKRGEMNHLDSACVLHHFEHHLPPSKITCSATEQIQDSGYKIDTSWSADRCAVFAMLWLKSCLVRHDAKRQ